MREKREEEAKDWTKETEQTSTQNAGFLPAQPILQEWKRALDARFFSIPETVCTFLTAEDAKAYCEF